MEGLTCIPGEDNALFRVRTNTLMEDIKAYRGNSGYFYEYRLSDICELRDFCGEDLQTIVFVGKEETAMKLIKCGVRGVDRIVPPGCAMNFDMIWDGYSLYEHFTRRIEVMSGGSEEAGY